MGKLHEILAVEGDLAGTAKKILDETINTFAKKPDHFLEQTAITTYFDDASSGLNTTVTSAMTTTVDDKLDYALPPIGRYYDAYASKEATNQIAKADIEIDGVVLVGDVPATVLLGMETKLKELRGVFEAIPTLAPGALWKPDATRGHVYRDEQVKDTFVTKRAIRPIELSPATKEHPAQVRAIEEDTPVAKRQTTSLSGMITPTAKSEYLGRLDVLIRAVKKARQRANGVEAIKVKDFGKTLLAFVRTGATPSAK